MNLFTSKTEEAFSFLVTEYGFTEPVAVDGSWKTTFLFTSNQIGIEVELNYKKMDVFVYLVKVENGQVLEGNEDLTERNTLENVLDLNPSKSNGDQTTIEEFERGITRKAELLKQHIDSLLKKSEVIFH